MMPNTPKALFRKNVILIGLLILMFLLMDFWPHRDLPPLEYGGADAFREVLVLGWPMPMLAYDDAVVQRHFEKGKGMVRDSNWHMSRSFVPVLVVQAAIVGIVISLARHRARRIRLVP